MTTPDRPRQLPLDLHPQAGLTRDDIVTGEANAAAVALVDAWPDWPAPVVVLAGPPGSGKSHLAHIWAERAGALALDARTLRGGFAVRGRPLLIDDADRTPVDETGLFHLVNDAMVTRNSVLMTARRFPAAWGLALPDVVSRLKAATTVEISEPDDGLLAGVIAKLFADRQVDVEPHVIQYLVRRIERSLSTAIRVVERLDAAALEQKSRITRALAAEAVTAMDEGQGTLDI